MITNPTEKALLARGIDSATAKQLREEGWTLSKLKLKSNEKLQELGLTPKNILVLRADRRPAIPLENLSRVLFRNRWLCCICRDPKLPIIVHHISPWSETHDHSPENLAVLCPIHHGEAHNSRGLELTLTPERIRKAKLEWEKRVYKKDSIAIQQATQLQSANWWYFNHLRLFELAQANEIKPNQLLSFPVVYNLGLCDNTGNIIASAGPEDFIYSGSNGKYLYGYMRELLSALLEKAIVRNISDNLDRSIVGHSMIIGDLCFVQGLHRFSDVSPAPKETQLVKGTRAANKVEISFVFDRACATSVSAWYEWLRGNQYLGSLIQVNRYERQGEKLRVLGTVLAIRSGLEGLKTRMYENKLLIAGFGHRSYEEDDEVAWDEFEEDEEGSDLPF
ncbi:HNH endonuclease signature motif containing protein [Pseudomonas sp. DP-17]|uniref:HNH endonuclease signature motif containing protein n=1 Tax=Pseudomonas sp. DP-17 TaxID=1580486 RepID=UPI001EFB43E6|nr:HNH endonuclease signature motif containing protein [Pseudomonas sp. DP-17]MCG8911312.1 HNH endonuclease [Pseudomonas sp. DP-17]